MLQVVSQTLHVPHNATAVQPVTKARTRRMDVESVISRNILVINVRSVQLVGHLVAVSVMFILKNPFHNSCFQQYRCIDVKQSRT